MGKDRHEKHSRERLEPFVPLLKSTLDSPAWQAMSHGAWALYTVLKRRYSMKFQNNGKLYVSQRKASKEIRSGSNQVARWFRELQHYGFIVKTAEHSLGVDGEGKAPHWRLTELGYMKAPPTNDFMRWKGKRFRDQPKQKSKTRKGIPLRGVTENHYGTVTENRYSKSNDRNGIPLHTRATDTVTEFRYISSLPSAQPSEPSLTALDGISEPEGANVRAALAKRGRLTRRAG